MYLWKKKLSTFPVRLSTIYGTDLFGAFLMYPDSSLFSLVVFDQSAPQVSSSGQFSHGSINSAILFSAACILRESICLNAHRTPMSLISCSVNTSPSFLVFCFCVVYHFFFVDYITYIILIFSFCQQLIVDSIPFVDYITFFVDFFFFLK